MYADSFSLNLTTLSFLNNNDTTTTKKKNDDEVMEIQADTTRWEKLKVNWQKAGQKLCLGWLVDDGFSKTSWFVC